MPTAKKVNTKEQIDADLTLKISGDYKDFHDFYSSNKQLVYEKILDLFTIISTDKKEIAKLVVFYDIEKTTFNTAFNFGKSDKEMLKEVFIPYFSEMEEYETCSRVTKLYDTLSN